MYSANVLAFFEKSTDALKWVGLAVAVVAMAFLLTDLIINIKKRKRTRLNIVALVFLVLSLICYVLTQWVLPNLPSLFGFVWVVFLAVYLVCDIILAVGIGRDNRRKKMGMEDDDEDASNATPATDDQSATAPTSDSDVDN